MGTGKERAVTMARGKGEGSIYRRAKDGLWCVSVELPAGIDGKRRRKVICRKDKGAVVTEMRKAQKQVADRGDIVTASPTVEQWLTYWLEEVLAKRARPKTYAGHRSVVTGHVIPAIGKVKLDRLTQTHVRKLHARMLATPKSASLRGVDPLPSGTQMLAPSYAGTAHDILVTALEDGIREGKLSVNVAKLVAAPKFKDANRRGLTLEEAVKLLAHLSTRRDGAMWATYLLTGARRGEVLGLEADRVTDVLDLSWQLQRISHIDKAPGDYDYRQVGPRLYLTRPKSKAGVRVVPLVEPLLSYLKMHIAAGNREGLIFTDGGRPWNPDKITEAWADLLAEAGLPDDIVLHGSRHTTVSLLYAARVPEPLIMEIVGHSVMSITRGYRDKGNLPQLAEAMNKVSELLAAPK